MEDGIEKETARVLIKNGGSLITSSSHALEVEHYSHTISGTQDCYECQGISMLNQKAKQLLAQDEDEVSA